MDDPGFPGQRRPPGPRRRDGTKVEVDGPSTTINATNGGKPVGRGLIRHYVMMAIHDRLNQEWTDDDIWKVPDEWIIEGIDDDAILSPDNRALLTATNKERIAVVIGNVVEQALKDAERKYPPRRRRGTLKNPNQPDGEQVFFDPEVEWDVGIGEG